jgi:hypothetical protein
MLKESRWVVAQVKLSRILILSICVGATLTAICGPALADGEAAGTLAAATIGVNVSIKTSLVSHRGTTVLYERGYGYGTPRGPLTVEVSVAGDTEATISFACKTSDGTLSGRGVTSYAADGPVAHFSGTLHLTQGTGRYAHASAAGLRIQGTIMRHSYALSARVTGTLHA